ncbi:MAG: hypothetical protein JNK05_02240 [Myxococcales bacterium]|nr:hypothetical protein [Myxococcales bacterium]
MRYRSATMTLTPSALDAQRFFDSSILALVWLDARSAHKRLGPTADAQWRAFAGGSVLNEADRLVLALRDAAVAFPSVFSGRTVFGLSGSTDDEPLGPELFAPFKGQSAKAFRGTIEAPSDAVSLVDALASRWGVALDLAVDAPSLGPTSRVVVAGTSALRALTARFAQQPELDAASQWLVVADAPAARHIAACAAMALGARSAPKIVASSRCLDARATLVANGFERVDRVLLSKDATEAERAACEALSSAGGAKRS